MLKHEYLKDSAESSPLLEGFPLEDYEDLYARTFRDVDPNSPLPGPEGDIAPNLAALLTDPSITIATVEDEEGLMGYSFALPIDRIYPSRSNEATETACIYYTGIEPHKQGEGYVGPLMERLFKKLKDQGYSYVERDCMINNGYANNVQKAYGPAIVESYDHANFDYRQPQRFFRIDLRQMVNKDH